MKAKKKVKKTKKRWGIFFPIRNKVERSYNFPKSYSIKTDALRVIEGQSQHLGYGKYTVKEIR